MTTGLPHLQSPQKVFDDAVIMLSAAAASDSGCPWKDCRCGSMCASRNECCCGSERKSDEDWIAYVKEGGLYQLPETDGVRRCGMNSSGSVLSLPFSTPECSVDSSDFQLVTAQRESTQQPFSPLHGGGSDLLLRVESSVPHKLSEIDGGEGDGRDEDASAPRASSCCGGTLATCPAEDDDFQNTLPLHHSDPEPATASFGVAANPSDSDRTGVLPETVPFRDAVADDEGQDLLHIDHADVLALKNTWCPWSDCTCGPNCGCKQSCSW